MNVGRLDIYGTIQYDAGNTKNESGERIHNWATYQTVWCQRLADSGNEGVAGDQIVGFETCIFKIRYKSGIKPKMRLIIGTDIWDIINIPYVDRMYMQLKCQKRDNEEYAT